MMFLKRRDFSVLAVFSLAALIGIGSGAYLSLRAGGNKFLAERFLFFSLSAASVFILLLYRTFSSSRRTLRELEKIIDMSRYSGIVAEDRLERFGPMGRSLKTLYHDLGELSNRRADRIYILSAVAEGLLSFVEDPVLVVDAAGKVLFAGEGFTKKYKLEASGTVGRPVAEILPEVDFKSVVAEAVRSHGPTEKELTKEKVTFYPLHDRSNEVACFIAAFGKQPAASFLDGWKKRAKEREPERAGESRRGLFRFFQDRFKRE
jgi:PAS domain-containing protein